MDNTFYICPHCKKEYDSPSDLAYCILSCEDKKKREDEERKHAELNLTKNARKKELEEAADIYHDLLKAYVKDYGTVSISNNYDDWASIIGDRPLRWWF